jgi:hypothetical protein
MRVLVAVYGSVGGVSFGPRQTLVCSKEELMKQRIPLGWAGIDVGKGHHWICLIDQSGSTVWSAKAVNDEAAILDAVGSVLARVDEVVWGVDVTATMSGRCRGCCWRCWRRTVSR